MSNTQGESSGKKPSFFQLVGSILSGAVGVQSSKNRERDFQGNSIMPYVVGGIIFTALFIGTIVTVINLLVDA